MTTSVLLERGCCPAGSAAVAEVERSGGKAVRVVPASGVSPLRDDGTPDADGWAWRVADVVGLSREALLTGCPVPLAAEVATWARVTEEVGSARWDAVVVPVGAVSGADLVEAPDVVLRVLDARLDARAGAVAHDRGAAALVSTLLELRPGFAALADAASTACTWGTRTQHAEHGCDDAGGLGLPACPAPGAAVEPTTGVHAADGALVWWLDLPAGVDPELHQEDDRLVVDVGRLRRTFRLPGALTRCRVQGAAMLGGRLEVRFEPDPDSWR